MRCVYGVWSRLITPWFPSETAATPTEAISPPLLRGNAFKHGLRNICCTLCSDPYHLRSFTFCRAAKEGEEREEGHRIPQFVPKREEKIWNGRCCQLVEDQLNVRHSPNDVLINTNFSIIWKSKRKMLSDRTNQDWFLVAKRHNRTCFTSSSITRCLCWWMWSLFPELVLD